MATKNKTKDLMAERMKSAHFGTPQTAKRISVLELDRVVPNPDNPRKNFDPVALDELAQSIDRSGLLQPIVVKKFEEDKYIIVAGERRYRAHHQLEKKTIEVIITDGDIDELALVENLQREDLKSIEAAESLDRLMKIHAYTQEEVAKAIGKARSTVTELLSLTKLPEDIKEKCRPADISRSFLVELVRMNAEDQRRVWELYEETGSTKRADLRAIRTEKKNAQPSEPKLAGSVYQKIERSLGDIVKTLDREGEGFSTEEIDNLLSIKGRFDAVIEKLSGIKNLSE